MENGLKLSKEILFLIKLYKITINKKIFRDYYFPYYFNKYNIKTNALPKMEILSELDCNSHGYSSRLINKWINEGVLKLQNGIDSRNRPLKIYSINQNVLKKKLASLPLFKEIYEIIENETTVFYGRGIEIKSG